MGGILFDDGLVYRVSQRQGFDMYGKSSTINHISICPKTDYTENKVSEIDPYFFNGLEVLTTLTAMGRLHCSIMSKARPNS